MSEEREVTITLSDAQIAQVVREASDGGNLVALLAGGGNSQRLHKAMISQSSEWGLSRALVRALLILAAFPSDGGDREMTEVAKQVGLSPSTAHRYIRTWTAFGFLEQMPQSRRYRRPPMTPKTNSTTAKTTGRHHDDN